MVANAILMFSEGWQQHCTQSAKCGLKTHKNEQL